MKGGRNFTYSKIGSELQWTPAFVAVYYNVVYYGHTIMWPKCSFKHVYGLNVQVLSGHEFN